MLRPSRDHIGCRASLKTSVIRVIAPPPAGMVQMLPCISVAMVLPSGEIETDIDVPSRTVTSIVRGPDAGFCVPAGARRGACPPSLPKAASARAVNPATPNSNNEISAARFMPRILQEVSNGCGSLFTRNYVRKSGHVDRAIDRRNNQIELRPFLGTCQDRSNRMEQGLALEAGPILDAIGRGAKC